MKKLVFIIISMICVNVVYAGKNVKSFDKHYSLVLSPDMIMLLISQGIATHINENAERLRDKLVDFEDQRTLKIVMNGDLLEQEEAWDWIIPAFSDSIDKNMKARFSDLMVCDFSTTGMVERISRLDDLELGWWRKELEPVLDEFVNASEGNVNRKFWRDMVNEYSPERRTQAPMSDAQMEDILRQFPAAELVAL